MGDPLRDAQRELAADAKDIGVDKIHLILEACDGNGNVRRARKTYGTKDLASARIRADTIDGLRSIIRSLERLQVIGS